MLWIMGLAAKDAAKGDAYAEDINPFLADAYCIVRDFAHLFPLLLHWRHEYGDGQEVTAYAMDTLEVAPGTPARDTGDVWDRSGPDFRLDTMPGGWVKVGDYRGTSERPFCAVSTQVVESFPVWPPVKNED